MHRSCFGRSELLFRQLYFKLYPSLKFLSSQNSLRIFFSPSRGEIKMFRLTKLKISTIFLNKPNFLNRKRLCLFTSSLLCVFASKSRLAASLPSCLAAKNSHLSKRSRIGALPPPRRLFLYQTHSSYKFLSNNSTGTSFPSLVHHSLHPARQYALHFLA